MENAYEIWNLEYQESVLVSYLPKNSDAWRWKTFL